MKLSGWKAWVIGLPLVAAILIGGRLWLSVGVNEKAVAPIRQSLVSTYVGKTSGDIQAAAEGKGDARDLVEKSKAAADVAIVAAHGRKVGKGVVVRVDFTVGGKPPPDGRSPRYFMMEERLLGDWRVKYETSALSYHLALW